jgi:hypothetical protein
MKRKINSRKLSKFKRKPLGSTDTHIEDILQKPVLTKRDKEVLLAIYFHRCLTTEQVAEMFFRYGKGGKLNSQASVIARRRLRKMFDYCLVDRFFIDVGENNGSSQAHMVLDSLGAKIVAGLLNIPLNELQWRYEMNETRLPYLEHMVKINDCYVSLLRKSREEGHEVTLYRTENHVRHEFKYWNQRVVFNPDAYGQYWLGDEGFHFFLELDNGTMTPGVFQKKHQRYTSFYASEEYSNHYENFPLVLTVTTTWERAEQLRKVIEKVDDTDVEWYFTSEEQFHSDPLGAVWLSKDEENPVTLL